MSASHGKDQFTYGGYYSTSGAMTLGNQVYPPNSGLATFINEYLIDPILQKYRAAGKVLPTSVTTATLGFVHNLANPTAAYKYCAPDMVFSNNTDLRQLVSEAGSRGFADFQIESITYGPGRSDATVVLQHPSRFWARALRVNLVRIGDVWMVIQAGTGEPMSSGQTVSSNHSLLSGGSGSGATRSSGSGSGSGSGSSVSQSVPGSPYDGRTPVVSIGNYHTLIIGPSVGTVEPTGSTKYGKKGQFTTVNYKNVDPSDFQHVEIIVYQRTLLTKGSGQSDASNALATDKAFQQAVAEAKARHAVLVVTGGGDNLLSRDMVVQALGGIESTTGDDTKPATTITVWFEGNNQAMFSGITAMENGGKVITALTPTLLDASISQAALIRDTWGAVSG